MVVAIQQNNMYSSVYWTRSLDHMPVHREEHVLRSSNALADTCYTTLDLSLRKLLCNQVTMLLLST